MIDPSIGIEIEQFNNVVSGATLGALVYLVSLIIWRNFSERHFKAYRALDKQAQLEWDGRAPSTAHAVYLSAYCIFLFLVSDVFSESKIEPTPYVLRTSPVSTKTLAFSAGYFAMDLVLLVLYYPSFGTGALAIHHMAAFASVTASALTGQGHAYTLLLLSTELTTPLVNIRWLLDKSGLKNHPLYILNGVAMATTWLLVRVLFMGMYFFPLSWRHRAENELLNPICYALLQTVPPLLLVLNLFWFTKILKGAWSLLHGKKVDDGLNEKAD